MWEFIQIMWKTYGANIISLVLYYLAVVWLLVFDKEKKKIDVIVYVLGIPGLILAIQIAMQHFSPEKVTMHLLALLPTGILLCYVGTRIAAEQKSANAMKKAWITILLYGIIIQSGVNLRYSIEVLQGGLNPYKISPTVCHLAEFITADEELHDPYVLAPNEVSTQIQEYDPNIRVYFHEGFEYSARDLTIVSMQMDQTGCNCVIVPTEQDVEEFWKENGYRMIVIFDGYTVYARV